MKIFLSWSGTQSHDYAQAFSDWLPCVIQAVEPWLSSRDIDRGAAWFNEIFVQLKDINFGILFVTKENQHKPWIMFEAGALSKGLKENRICTLLCDMNVRDIDPGSPLRNINHSEKNKSGVLQLLKTVNKALPENSIKEEHLEKAFDALWPALEKSFSEIETSAPKQEEPTRQDSDVLNDILNSVLSIDKKVSRTSHSNQSVIHRKHADKLLNRFVELGISECDIIELLDDLVPSGWLRGQLKEMSQGNED
ncbi:toll-Interleukin receptor [Vibrio alginolyticus]|uniref:toll-Interleukin receptor n=1 Tax=Vibrio alginolyticus TaxID=663 RepID=UPI00148C00BE|nr:toll-Interleukin receptor [Vibrio alginolyticus]MCQ9103934.1 toll-Interleukin receptor [Vibrio alginolyticus]NOI46214.1 TIR domain-containing protein [Vibrio alginolyticus]